jgi:hypothetical protein
MACDSVRRSLLANTSIAALIFGATRAAICRFGSGVLGLPMFVDYRPKDFSVNA